MWYRTTTRPNSCLVQFRFPLLQCDAKYQIDMAWPPRIVRPSCLSSSAAPTLLLSFPVALEQFCQSFCGQICTGWPADYSSRLELPSTSTSLAWDELEHSMVVQRIRADICTRHQCSGSLCLGLTRRGTSLGPFCSCRRR